MSVSVVRGVSVTNVLAGRRFLVEFTLNSSSENVTTYKIYRSTTEYGTYSEIAQVTSPTYQYIDIVPYTYGVVYYYRVIGVSSAGEIGDLNAAPPVSDMTFDSFEEAPFRPTTVMFSSFIVGEIPTGNINSSNKVYTLANLFRIGSSALYLSGLRQIRGVHYTEGTDQRTLTFVTAPTTGATLTADYLKV